MVELDEGPLFVTQPIDIESHGLSDGLAMS